MIRNLRIRRHRAGFTLIELMVVMTLTMFIMAVLAQSFGTGLDTFRQLKAIGDMQDGLRTATTIIRSDLTQDHFEGKRRLSDPNFWQSPIREGFFAIRQGSPSTDEGPDSDNLRSQRAVDHVLHFSMKLRGNRKENFFYANVPPSSVLLSKTSNLGVQPFDGTYIDQANAIYGSQWAEVAYFLVKSGTVITPENPAGPGTPLYSLYRCQLIGVPASTSVNNQEAGQIANYGSMSCYQDTATSKQCFYTPNDWAQGKRRIDPTPATIPTNFQPISSLVLQNVVSFQVQGLKSPSATGQFEDITTFDTTTNPAYLLQGVQITIRVFDTATRQVRQVTVAQDL